MNSCVYNGLVTHKRFKPVKHFLKYKTFSMFLDLDEIEKLDKKISIFSFNKFNIYSFYNKDHGNRDGYCLKKWVFNNLKNNGVKHKISKIRLLCYPRIFGYVFNPLSIFFVYDKKSNLIAILYEVKNTFGEQHTYVFKVNENNKFIKNNCEKKFFVSPFMNIDSKYYFKVLDPNEKLSVVIDQRDKDGKLLFASQDGVKSNFTSKNLIFSYLRHPLMTFKIISAIHFEALRLWIKGIKIVKKKIKIINNISFEK